MDPQQRRVQRLAITRRWAMGLLGGVTGVYLFAAWAESAWGPGFGYLRAFAEAAMVGGVADWFAVTALFRHPFGLKIPHTAIIPSNKNSIGSALGDFVQNNFLAPEVVRQKLEEVDIDGALRTWFATPSNTAQVAEQVVRFLPNALGAINQDMLQELGDTYLAPQVSGEDLGKGSAWLLDVVVEKGYHQPALTTALTLAADWLKRHPNEVRQLVQKESPWYVPGFMRDQVANKVVESAQANLAAIIQDQRHPTRLRMAKMLRDLANDLRTQPNRHAELEAAKTKILQPDTYATVAQFLNQLRDQLMAENEAQSKAIRETVRRNVYAFSNYVLSNGAVRQRLAQLLVDTVATLAATYRKDIAELIAGTIRAWDEKTVSEKLEIQVGKDLQFIRINGTLVGGLVGLLIYTFSQLVFHP